MDGGFKLRDYQSTAADAAEVNNLLVVLPTNSGKTVIAAECILRTLQQELTKKVVFLAPKKALVLQQARLLLRHIDTNQVNLLFEDLRFAMFYVCRSFISVYTESMLVKLFSSTEGTVYNSAAYS